MEVNNKKLKRSINIYPIFYGLSADLIFWIAINTLFLTTVKGLSASQVNSIEAIATGIGIIFQLFLVKIVRKIGNLNSVRLGVTLLFLAAVLNTFCTHYLGFLIAELCYTIGLLLCKNKDKLTAKWSLKSTNVPIGISSFELDKYISKDVLEKLPSEEDLNLHIDINK